MAGFLGALPASAWNAGSMAWPGAEIMDPMQPLNIQPLTAQMPAVNPLGGQGAGGLFGIQGLGMNIDTARLGLGGLQALGGLWSARQQNKLARDSFNHQKGILDTNLANSIKSYNLSLDDRLRSRQVVEGTSDATREAERAKWEATDRRRG